MQVTDALVDKIANLAKLSFNEVEKKEIREDLEISGTQPLMHMSREVNVLREDVVIGSVSAEEALKNAPGSAGPFFTVPKVINK